MSLSGHRLLRPLLAVTLALMLALTGQSLAIARAAPGPSGEMVLCTGTGPVMVHVDETGAPTGPPVWCPDGAFGLLNLVAIDAPALPLRTARRESLPWPIAAQARTLRPVSAHARAPPLTA